MLKRFFLFLAFLSWSSSPVLAQAQEPALQWFPAQVADASDRAYEKTAIWLIDQAKYSAVLSMYLIAENEDDRHPVNRLFNDLREALNRGVKVELYLNTKFREIQPEEILQKPILKHLQEAGAKVVALSPGRRLHDKLLIVDERYILEGSANWSVEALRNNWESNTLIDSPALARLKLNRLLQRVTPYKEPMEEPGKQPLYPETVALPVSWTRKEGILPRMAIASDEQSFDTLFLLLRESSTQASDQFFINLEELGIDLGLPRNWDDTMIRRQVIKVLRKLKRRYQVIDLQLTHAKDAWIKMQSPQGSSVLVPMELLGSTRLKKEPAALTYLTLLELVLEKDGQDLSQWSVPQLASLTGLSPKLIRRTLRLKEL